MVRAVERRRKAAAKRAEKRKKEKETQQDEREEEDDADDVPMTPGRDLFPSSSLSDITSDSDAWSSDEDDGKKKRKSKCTLASFLPFLVRPRNPFQI